MNPKYVTVEVEDLPPEIGKEEKGWGFVCENHHGCAYWNSETGEFCWVGDKIKLSKLA